MADRPEGTADRLMRWFAAPGAMRQLVVVFCVAVMLVAVAIQFPEAFADANRTARDNAALDYLDREIGGGNSVVPDQSIAIEARGQIPVQERFRVEVGQPREDWGDSATPDALDNFMRFFLLPRRGAADAKWLVCFACDRSAHSGATVVWENDEGLAILRLPT